MRDQWRHSRRQWLMERARFLPQLFTFSGTRARTQPANLNRTIALLRPFGSGGRAAEILARGGDKKRAAAKYIYIYCIDYRLGKVITNIREQSRRPLSTRCQSANVTSTHTQRAVRHVLLADFIPKNAAPIQTGVKNFFFKLWKLLYKSKYQKYSQKLHFIWKIKYKTEG